MPKTRRFQPQPPAVRVDPRNRMNDLDSQTWLKFQKSWFVVRPGEFPQHTVAEFIQFFTKRRPQHGGRTSIGLLAENATPLVPLVESLDRHAVVLPSSRTAAGASVSEPDLDYAVADLCDLLRPGADLNGRAEEVLVRLRQLAQRLRPQAYLTVFVRNHTANHLLVPLAWLLGKAVSEFLALKDEKIGCESTAGQLHLISAQGTLTGFTPPATIAATTWATCQDVIYCLNFRRVEDLPPVASGASPARWPENRQEISAAASDEAGGRASGAQNAPRRLQTAWFVPKPPPREKGVLLHPAKFPESLVGFFLREFSQEGERIFDPMAGTGSTLLAASSLGRQAYGIELNPQFHRIARERMQNQLAANALFVTPPAWHLVAGDAADPQSYTTLPAAFDYILTSPPYWDMLRMKGAETQARRREAGLLQFYSDDARDLGNRADYEEFLRDLVRIYEHVATRLAAGRYMTIVVKNVKKRGKVHPLAWDLALRLDRHLELCHEQFWCQDDLRLAPFGYRFAWVSNTMHHYCLHFRRR